MKTQKNTSIKSLFLASFVCLIVVFSVAALNLRNLPDSADEQAIRNIVEKMNKTGEKAPYTDDRIFWSGAYPNPIIGKVSGEEDKKLDEKMKKERLNFKSISKIERLVVAKSGDIAYEYGTGTLNWDTPEKHIQFNNAHLRTWKKVNGQWKIDAFFVRPLNSEIARRNQ